MTTMLDKLIEAIMDSGPVGCCTISEREAKEIARAALQAIREPSDEMLAPACRTHRPGEPMSEARPEECPAISRRRARFTTMIDAILSESA